MFGYMYRDGGARVCWENEFSFPTDVFENSYTHRVRKVFTSCWQYLPGVRGKVQPDTRIIVMLAPRHPPRVSGNVLVPKTSIRTIFSGLRSRAI